MEKKRVPLCVNIERIRLRREGEVTYGISANFCHREEKDTGWHVRGWYAQVLSPAGLPPIDVIDDCGGSNGVTESEAVGLWVERSTVDGRARIEGRWSAVNASGTVPVPINCREARP